MDNPAVASDHETDDDEDDEDYELEEGEFAVELHNGLDGMIDIVQVLDIRVAGVEVIESKFDDVVANETVTFYAFEGDRLQAFRAGTHEVVSDIEIRPEKIMYTISSVESLRSEL